jgi:hypothetical protein
MIPYPSTSPAAQNVTYVNDPVNTVAAAVGGTALGAVAIASMVALAQSMKSRGKRGKRGDAEDAEEREEGEGARDGVDEGTDLAYLCVKASDVEGATRVLLAAGLPFKVLDRGLRVVV